METPATGCSSTDAQRLRAGGRHPGRRCRADPAHSARPGALAALSNTASTASYRNGSKTGRTPCRAIATRPTCTPLYPERQITPRTTPELARASRGNSRPAHGRAGVGANRVGRGELHRLLLAPGEGGAWRHPTFGLSSATRPKPTCSPTRWAAWPAPRRTSTPSTATRAARRGSRRCCCSLTTRTRTPPGAPRRLGRGSRHRLAREAGSAWRFTGGTDGCSARR